tara:strand:+ start:1692 stop:1814 length:123 start_codon:yes stop_codon:yes gene_type:complete
METYMRNEIANLEYGKPYSELCPEEQLEVDYEVYDLIYPY